MKTLELSDEECIMVLLALGLQAAAQVPDALGVAEMIVGAKQMQKDAPVDMQALVKKFGDYSKWKPPLKPVDATPETFSTN